MKQHKIISAVAGAIVALIMVSVIANGSDSGSPSKGASASRPTHKKQHRAALAPTKGVFVRPTRKPAPTSIPPTPMPPTAQPAVVTLLKKQGSGQWTSPTFDAPSDWALSYAYDCSNFGSSGNFIVSVYGPGNTPTADGVNELKAKGHGATFIHDVSGAGTYIQVNSECDWVVEARG